MGPGGTLLFFGSVCAFVVPFALLCLPETKGRSLEEITPMFRFASFAEWRRFVRGNLHSGDGMGAGGETKARDAAHPGAASKNSCASM